MEQLAIQLLARRTDPQTSHAAAERWKQIAGFEGWYEVSTLGRVRRVAREIDAPQCGGKRKIRERLLIPGIGRGGYLHVSLSRNGVIKTKRITSLILTAFVGPRPQGMECGHWDGNRQNNHLSNLRWCTSKDNAADRDRHGNTARGERNGFSKYNEDIARKVFHSRLSTSEICKAFNVNRTFVYDVKVRGSWKHAI